jgi:two-component system sensor histidine kinase KdpD
MRGYKAAHGIEESWHTGERVLVCVSPSPHSTRLVRAARRMATSLHAELVGVYVETQASVRLPAEDREQLARNMRLVESLGGEAVVLRAEDVAVETVRYARKRNATKIVVGKPTRPRWRELFRASFLDQIVRQSLEIDVYVISGQASDLAPPAAPPRQEPRKALQLAGGLAAIVVTTLCTLIGWYGFGQDQLADVVMVYLLGVIVVSMRYGYVPSLLAAVLGVVAFDFFFIPPYYSFSVSDLRHIVTFGVMFLVAVVVSHLTKRIRDQADSARRSERRAASLYSLSREVGLAPSRDLLLAAAERHLREVFGVRVAVLLPGPDGMLDAAFAEPGTLDDGQKDKGVAEWAWLHQRPAGAGTDTLPSARALFVPLKSARGRVGVLALYPSAETRLGDPEDRQLLDTFAGLIGSALERTQLADEARRAHLRAETEQLRNSLLSSVSHDLRTPLAVVTGATSSLLDEHGPRDEHVRRELLQTVHEEALRLNRLVRNLLDMTRLEAGALKVHEEMQPIEEVVGSALDRMDDRLRGRAVDTRIPADLPLVPFDSALIEQVLINLLENATKYTPAGTPIEVAARTLERFVEVEVNDRGPGVGPRDTERVFDKFYRAREGEGGGVGLGLTICRGIVSAHGGRIWVEERAGGGASFRFRLPLEPKASGPALAAPQEQESQAR